MMNVDILKKLFPSTDSITLEKYVKPINDTFTKYDISNMFRQAAFMAQVGHESGGLRIIKENLNYSVKGLKSTFPKYFPGNLADSYAKQPEKIANRVYANRMGNGPESSGDGWKFRGRGLIQITGKNNYTNLAKEFNMSLDEVTNWLETSEGATFSAGWFWDLRNLNDYADDDDIVKITKLINGGTNGLQDRKRLYELAKTILIHIGA